MLTTDEDLESDDISDDRAEDSSRSDPNVENSGCESDALIEKPPKRGDS